MGVPKNSIAFALATKHSKINLIVTCCSRMDAFACGLKIWAAIRKDGRLAEFVKQHYASCDSGIEAKIEAGNVLLKEIKIYILKKGEVTANTSDRQEFLENLINEFL